MARGRAALVVILAGLGTAGGATAGALAGGTPAKSQTITIDESQGADGLFLTALNEVGHRFPRCFGLGRGPTTFDHGAPGQDLLKTLGVLRRKRTAADQLSRSLLARVHIHAVLIRYARRIETPDGHSYLLLPSSEATWAPYPPAVCGPAQARSIRRHGRDESRATVRRALRQARRHLAEARRRAREPKVAGVFFYEISKDDSSFGGGGPTSAAEIRDRGTMGAFGTSDRATTFMSLVPDGVAKVALEFGKTDTAPGKTVTADVTDNVVSVPLPRRPESAFPSQTTWYDADGNVIKSFNRR